MANELEKYQPGPKYSLVKASFDLEVARKNYQLLLQNLASITVTRDNVNEDLTKDAREILKALDDHKDEQSKEPLQWHKDIMAVYKNLRDPVKQHLDRINDEKKVVALGIQAETNKQIAEQNRINAAKAAIIDFGNKIANMIATAKTDLDIAAIEKLIGLEKTRATVYQEFIPDLVVHCDALRPQIKVQKDNIRNLLKTAEAEKVAMETGDYAAAAEARDKKEYFQQVVAETGIRIHETAFEQASTIEIVAPEVVDIAPKGRSNWKWRVDDIKLLQKKMPHLVKVVPDDEAIDILLTTKKKDGSLDGKTEEKWNGITFFNDKTFKR